MYIFHKKIKILLLLSLSVNSPSLTLNRKLLLKPILLSIWEYLYLFIWLICSPPPQIRILYLIPLLDFVIRMVFVKIFSILCEKSHVLKCYNNFKYYKDKMTRKEQKWRCYEQYCKAHN